MTHEQQRRVDSQGLRMAAKDGWHPEVIVGIPYAVITARPANKHAQAKRIGYPGPVNLAEAIEAGWLQKHEAKFIVSAWFQCSQGREATPEELADWCESREGRAE